jgi:hypothetical protein
MTLNARDYSPSLMTNAVVDAANENRNNSATGPTGATGATGPTGAIGPTGPLP